MAGKEKKRLICPHCGYAWNYGGKLLKATCPSCNQKVDVEEYEVDKDE